MNIVKYSNRKLYVKGYNGSAKAAYISLEELATLPVGSFTVMDKVTKLDITSQVQLDVLVISYKNKGRQEEAIALLSNKGNK